MIVDEGIAIIERTTKHLMDTDPHYDDHPAIIATPGWWEQKVKEQFGAGEEDGRLEVMMGCPVVHHEGLAGPILIAHDGRYWSLLPAWMRAPTPGQQS